MAKWAEIKCERCAETDALWEGMERSLEESDAREARLEAKLTLAVAFIEDLEGYQWPLDVQAERILAKIKGADND